MANTKIKVLDLNGQRYTLSGDASGIYEDLGITDERFLELLDRDAYTPTLSAKPTEQTATYIDEDDQSECPFRVGQFCVYPEGLSVLKSIEADGRRIWVELPYKLTKHDIEETLTGDITTHNHATQLATALADYVKKVSGKDLSTNDFTKEFKDKLEGLSNYDDTAVQEAITAINGRIDTLVGSGATEAIDTFKEIEAFLAGITDKQTLTGLLKDLKQEIVALIPSIDNLATKAEVAAKQDTLVSGSNIKTINKTSIVGEGNIEIKPGIDEAPEDSKQYARQNGTWTEVKATGNEIEVNNTGEFPVDPNTDLYIHIEETEQPQFDAMLIPEAPMDGGEYVRKNGMWKTLGQTSISLADTESDPLHRTVSDKGIENWNNKQVAGDYALKSDLNSKQNTLVSGSNIKTINGQSILTRGNVVAIPDVPNDGRTYLRKYGMWIPNEGVNPTTPGIFIYHTNGHLYTVNEWNTAWNANAVGIAVVDISHSFIISPNGEVTGKAWGGYGKTLTNIKTSSNTSVSNDNAGRHNTTEIINQLKGYTDSYGIVGAPAAEYCQSYKFKDGKIGYLGAYHEWYLVFANYTEINDCLNKIGGQTIHNSSYYYWTSTQGDSYGAWRCNQGNNFNNGSKYNQNYYTRPFTYF